MVVVELIRTEVESVPFVSVVDNPERTDGLAECAIPYAPLHVDVCDDGPGNVGRGPSEATREVLATKATVCVSPVSLQEKTFGNTSQI
jgi:hypothetical protein